MFRSITGRTESSAAAAVFVVAWFLLLATAWLRLLLWRCPRCGRAFFFAKGYRNPFARRCMHCGLPKWRRSPGPDLPVAEPTEPRPRHVQAELTFLPTVEGGRESPVFSGYRGQLHYDDHDWDAEYAFIDRELIQPGETATAQLWLMSPEAHRGRLVPGKSFQIREGRRLVGSGVVTKVLAL